MSKLIGFAGDDDFCLRGSIYKNPKEQSLFLSLDNHVDLYFPSRKRSRISAPFVFSGERFEQKKQASIDVLPDECLFEIFRHLPGGEERSACSCVSKRWLSLVSNMSRDELCGKNEEKNVEVKSEADNQEIEGDGYLSRSLEGKKTTDVRLAAIAVGTAGRGGLGKLAIRGNNSNCGVTSVGLRAISRGCPSLKALSLWNLPLVGDEGLLEIANGCHMLEKLDLCGCPAISDKGLLAVAMNCPNLTDLTIESCSNIGNEGLQAVGRCCTNLRSISIKNCPIVGDQGIVGLVSSGTCALTKVKLQSLNITDASLAVIGHYGKTVTDLVLTSLPNVSERGFWVMGNGHGLQMLKSFTVISCLGMTDAGLEAVGKGCPSLRQFRLCKSALLSDCGLVSFVKAAGSLESLLLEECHRITQLGLFGSLLKCGAQLKTLSLVSCLGYRDLNLALPQLSPCESLRTLCIRNCPGFGDSSLALLGKLCPQLQHLELSGLQGVTDAGFIPLLESSGAGLVNVNLSGCVNVSDKVVSELTVQHGWTLEVLNVDGCGKITDASLAAIAENCFLLSELDVSKCAVSDCGIAALSRSKQLNLQVFSASGCSMISDRSLPAFVKMGRTLQGLNLQHCNAISTTTVDLLVERLWRCDILS
ncbi:EIN3-binding F-box protein 1 [Euphorbia lathyris]|uniref:EIN3-binding F-box protein 1 n=1 Tax=Euphorbia lathyris TaxID=212925 RepID=UPI0033141081